MCTRGDRVPCALEIRHENRNRQLGQLAGEGDDLGCIGELWQNVRRYERPHLDLTAAGGRFSSNPALLGGGRHNGLDALQAIARTNFADQYCVVFHAFSVAYVAFSVAFPKDELKI